MFDARCKVMIVEDAVENQQLLEGLLEDDYDLSITDSAESFLERLPGDRPDLILLDVGLPGMDGYEVCRRVKSSSDTWDIPVIFVSGKSSTEEQLAGYEAGGDEYVTKPVAPDELLSKVERSLLAKQEEALLKQIIEEAQLSSEQTTLTGSELAGLNLFMQHSGSAMFFDELIDHLLRATRAFGIQISVLLRTLHKDYFYGCDANSLEGSMLLKSKNQGRFVHLQSRTVVNAGECSVLIKNMPLADQDRCKRICEHVAVMADAVATRSETLQGYLDASAQRKSTLRNLLKNTNRQFLNIRDKINMREIHERSIVLSMRQTIQDDLSALGLEEGDQQRLIQKFDGGIRQFNELPDVHREVEQSFKTTREILSRLLDQD